MIDVSQRRVFCDGEVAFQEGADGDDAFLIDDGCLEVYRDVDGERVVLAQLGPGEIVGEMALIDEYQRSASVRSVGRSTVTVINRRSLQDRLNSSDPMVRLIMRSLLARFRIAITRVRNGERGGSFHRVPESEVPPSVTDDQLRDDVSRRSRLEADLREAVSSDRLVLHYQPIVHLPLGKRAGFEALVRWPNADGSLIPPGDFIPIAEQTSLILALDQWVLRRACQEMAARPGREYVSVNLSARQFASDAVYTTVSQALQDTGLPPHRLQIEVTEGVVMEEPARAAELLRAFQALGVSIAIDDFGTGYSSLSYLHHFAVDVLKLDMSFAREVRNSPSGGRIVRACTAMADELGMKVVAEGVETLAEGRQLFKLGCELGQGWGYGRPVPMADHEQVA